MELRYNEVDRAREIFELYIRCHPDVKAWVRYAKFEMKNSEIGLARGCYERAVEELGEDAQTVSCLSTMSNIRNTLFPTPFFLSCPDSAATQDCKEVVHA